MKLFHSVQRYFETIGIYSPCPNQRYSSINWINFGYLIVYAQIMISSGGFLLFQAKTAVEYGFAFYTFICGLASAAAVLISIWKKEKMFNLLQGLEKFIEKS